MAAEQRRLGSRYLVGELLGRGGMGEVFRGWDSDGDEFAIKILRRELATDPRVVTRFVAERMMLTRVRDPHLVRVHDLVVEGDTLAIVMDLVPGVDLRAALGRVAGVPPAEVARIGAGTAAGLHAAHAAGVVHRDVKPENVLLDSSSAPPGIRLTDFGIARLVSAAALTSSTNLLGTPFYMAPEVFTGKEASASNDLYSLGVMLYELSCGCPPFVGDPITVMDGHVAFAPSRPEGMPDPLWDLTAALLAKDPGLRPATAGEVRSTLDDLAFRLLRIPPAPRLRRPPEPRRMPAASMPISDADRAAAHERILAEVPILVPPQASAPPMAPPYPSQSPAQTKRSGLPGAAIAVAVFLCLLAGAGGGIYLLQSQMSEPATGVSSAPDRSALRQPVDAPSPASDQSSSAELLPPRTAPQPVPEPTPSCVPGANWTVDLSIAMDGTCREDVRRLQRELAARGYYPYEVDGNFGPLTEQAVRAFQRDEGLTVDGSVGIVETWPELFPDG